METRKNKGKGFDQHQSLNDHSMAMQAYKEGKMRKARDCSVIASLVSLNSDQKQWLFAVFNVSRFLCANALPFRGSYESDIDTGGGLFLKAFSQLLFSLEQ